MDPGRVYKYSVCQYTAVKTCIPLGVASTVIHHINLTTKRNNKQPNVSIMIDNIGELYICTVYCPSTTPIERLRVEKKTR